MALNLKGIIGKGGRRGEALVVVPHLTSSFINTDDE